VEQLVRITDRYVVTIVYFFLGLLNAPSWPYLTGFVAVGLLIDALAPRFLSPTTADKDSPDYNPELAHKAGWRRLYCLAAAYLVLDYGVPLAATILSASSPELLDAMGPPAFTIASPFSPILRNHYGQLFKDEYIARANLVAVVYAGLFFVFYATLAMALSINRCSFPDGTILRAREGIKPRKAENWRSAGFVLILSIFMVFIIHVVTFPQIDYSDENLRSRHLNLNLRDHNKFFYDLAFFLSGFCLFFPLAHQTLRYLLLKRRQFQAFGRQDGKLRDGGPGAVSDHHPL
jgi:hypothetical protein